MKRRLTAWTWRLRKRARKRRDRWITDHLVRLGFVHYFRPMVHGPEERLHFAAKRDAIPNTIFNTRSGHIHIGRDVVIGHDCMFLTGRHEFAAGRLKPKGEQVPDAGYDIRVGDGCWIASGAIVLGGVTVGAHSIVAAGAVVSRDVPAGSIVGGVPARIIGKT